MYRTSEGDRILLGAERHLFEASLAMIVDMLADDLFCDDSDFGFEAFDNLRRNQKLAALYIAGRGLQVTGCASPPRAAFVRTTGFPLRASRPAAARGSAAVPGRGLRSSSG
jgi:hypothetical protein